MSTATRVTVVFVSVWVVLKVQKAGEDCNENRMKKSGGNEAIGVLLVLVAVVLWPTSNIVAFGVGLLGLYLVLGGKF